MPEAVEERASLRAAPLLVAAGSGLVSGAFGAYCYYDSLLRPLAHSFALWLVVLVVVATARPRLQAVAVGVVVLGAAVIAFYVGKKVMYAVRYPGMPYELDLSGIALWLVLAVVAGVGVGWVLHLVGRPGWPGAIAVAAVAGLLPADVLRRALNYPDDAVVIGIVAVIGLVALAVQARDRWQLTRGALLAVPAVIVALVLVALPDAAEQLLFTGGF